LLLILAKLDGGTLDGRLIVHRRITHEQLAGIVGATRQWVTSMLARFQAGGMISIEKGAIVIERPDRLQHVSS
jgi:CRP-like cAMP-binding protein